MIHIYEAGYERFETMGLGRLDPAYVEIHEEQGGAYELELDHPMDELGKHELIQNGRVIKCPAPSRPTPLVQLYNLDGGEKWKATASTAIYSQAKTSTGYYITETVTPPQPSPLLMRSKFVQLLYKTATTTRKRWVSNGNRVLQRLTIGNEVTILSKQNPNFYRVASSRGTVGFVPVNRIAFDRIDPGTPGDAIQERQLRDQLFQIYRVENDTKGGTVKAWARHVFYNLLGNVIINGVCEQMTVAQVLNKISVNCTQPDHGFKFYSDDDSHVITADYSYRCIVDAILNPEDGILALANLRIVRDNFDVFLLKRSTTKRNPIVYGGGLLGISLEMDDDGVINRIIPLGKDKDGNMVTPGPIDSPRNNEATFIRAQAIEYDVQENKAGGGNPAFTLADVMAKLTELAEADFAGGIDSPAVSMRIECLQLGDTEEYKAYRDLDRMYLGDIIPIQDDYHGIWAEAEINEYRFLPLQGRYAEILIGETDNMRLAGSVSSFMISGVSGHKIVPGGVDASRLKNLSVTSAKIGLASIDAAHIKNAAIDTAHVKDAAITKAQIASAAIDTARIENGAITNAKIGSAAVKSANIDEAAIDTAHIKNGSITYAKMAEAAVGTLEADFLDAVRADIDYITTNQLTTDDLYVNLATIAKAQIKYANFDTALVGLLSADALDAVRADINTIVSNNLTSDQLYVNLAAIAVAQLTTANIQNASISWASINTLAAVIASIADTQIGTAQIDYAKIVDLVTETAIITEGVGGELYISRLAVTDANMVSLTVGDLMLKASNGSFVRLTVDELGDVVGVPVLVEGDNIDEATISGDHLIAGTITARELNVSQIMASSAMVGAIKAANIDVANLFAATATISQLDSYIVSANTIEALQGELSVWADDKISVAVGDLDDRLTMAEETITPEAIVSTVVGSEAYREALDRKADAEDLDGLATMAEVQQINQTTIAQTANNITLSVRQEQERAQAVEGEIRAFTDTAQTYFEFALDGLYIGKYGSPFRTLAGNEKYSFLQDGVEVAYIQYNRLYIKAAHILDVLTIGNLIDGFTDITAESGGITAEWRDS